MSASRHMLACWTALLLLAGCSGGCRGVQPAGPPPLPPLDHVAAPVHSSLILPIEIPTDELNALVDEVVPWQLYLEENRPVRKGLARARLTLDVRRRGGVRIETRNGQIITHLPLQAEGHIRVLRGLKRPFQATFTIHAVTDLSLDSTWTTTARTHSAFTWREEPKIGLLGFQIDVSGIAGKALEKQLARLAPRIDRIIEERVNLRWRAERLWESLAAPMPVREQPPVWLTVAPSDAFFVPGISRNDTLVFGLGIRALVKTVVGDAPPPPQLGPLPPLHALPDSAAEAVEPTFAVHLPLTLSYTDANELLAASVGKTTYPLNEQVSFRLHEVELYGRRDSLVARIDFRADLLDASLQTRGRIFLMGVPTFDPANQTLRLNDFNYDVQSELALAETADWFLRDAFLAAMRERLVLPLGDRLENARRLIDEALDARALGRHVLIDGTVETFAPESIYLTTDGIGMDLYAHGTLAARVHSLDDIRRNRSTSASR